MPDPFPRGTSLPTQSPLYWVEQKDRYLRQLLIRDIEALTKRRLVVYFANRYENAQTDANDPTYVVETLEDVKGSPVDLLLETIGGFTDSTEAVVSIVQKMAPDLRVVVPNAAKSNGTLICLAGKSIVMGVPSELGPVEPHINQIPSTILIDPAVAAQNFVLHKQGEFALSQTRKLATQLLTNGMMKGRPINEISEVVEKLLTRKTYPSHGSVIDYKEAKALGFSVEYLPPEDELWQRFRLLACMYQSDARKNRYLKVFEGSARSAAIEIPVVQPPGTPHP
jgi:Serine dehydrogenase proteinase